MPRKAPAGATLQELDAPTRALTRLSATLAAAGEETVRSALAAAAPTVPHEWIEELLLQTYLFAGFPRALNGMREWRRLVPSPPPATLAEVADADRLVGVGEETCVRVYGHMYARLRRNIAGLHPRLDDWMIAEGYGKVLSRPALDLPRRELCIVAACAATGQHRQLQSHLHGARNAGVPGKVIATTLDALAGVVAPELLDRATRLWARIAA